MDRTFPERAGVWLNSGHTQSYVGVWKHPKAPEKKPHELHPEEYKVFVKYWRDMMEDRLRGFRGPNGGHHTFKFFGSLYRIRYDYKSPDGEAWCDFLDMSSPVHGSRTVVLRIDTAKILIQNMRSHPKSPITENLFAELLIAHVHFQ